MRATVVRILLLAGVTLILAGCGEDTVTKTEQVFPLCSATYPFGTCGVDTVCFEGVCVDPAGLCSSDNPTGTCGDGETCFGGGCLASALLCSDINPTGVCAAGKVCDDGGCVDSEPVQPPVEQCGPADIDGPCPEGQVCFGGVCTIEDELCSATNLDGACAIGRTCLEGTCTAMASLCSGVNPTGVCGADMTCRAGLCVEPDEPPVDPCSVHVYTTQPNVLAHTDETGCVCRTFDGIQYRDLDRNGELTPYEDWRLSASCRARDLVSRMDVDQIIGLMRSASDIGQVSEDGVVSERDHDNIVNAHRRQSLVRSRNYDDPVEVATYFNAAQELAEAQPLGIPIVFLEDPSHSLSASLWSNWPGPLGLGAINDYDVTWHYGDTVRQEYLAIGYRMQYGPMADLATEPRWRRVSGVFGENAWAVARHVAATVSGFQGSTTGDVRNGIIATPKHFPGHGAEFEGFDAHNYEGRWIVFPGDNFMYHTIPFQAAFDVGARAIMPCYGIFLGQTDWDPEQVSSGFSYGMITELAKEHMGFDGLVTADWGVMGTSRGWGLESLPLPDRVAMWFHAGSHQFGSDPDEAIWEAYQNGLIDRADLDEAAVKILENFFKLGLFENPYVDAAAAGDIVRSAHFRQLGFEAQKLAIVILGNRDHAMSGNQAVSYLPIDGARYIDANSNSAPDPGEYVCDTDDDGVVRVYYDGSTDGLVGSDGLDDVLDGYDYTSLASGTTLAVEAVATLQDADIAVIRISSQGDLDFDGDADGEKVVDAFRVRDGYTNASGELVEPTNPTLKIVLVESMSNAAIVRPFINGLVSLDETPGEPGSYPSLHEENLRTGGGGVDAFLVDFGAFDRAVLDVLFDLNVPTGDGLPAPSEAGWSYGIARLPIEIPSSLEEVQAQFEDLPNDTLNPTFRIGAGSGY